MSFGGRDPSVSTFDSTNPRAREAEAQTGSRVAGWMANPQGAGDLFRGMQNPAMAGMLPFLMNAAQSGGNTPGMGTLASLMRGDSPFMVGAASNPFTQMMDPFGALGGQQQGALAVAGQLPSFLAGLSRANSELGRIAPGRFSSALAQQGSDLNSQALRDFNATAQNTLLQGLGLDLTNRGQARDFALGARGLQQSAHDQARQGGLQAAGLQLGAANAANQTGANNFANQLAAAQFGLQQDAQFINPALQLLLGGMQWAQPQPRQAIVDPGQQGWNPLQTALQMAPLFFL